MNITEIDMKLLIIVILFLFVSCNNKDETQGKDFPQKNTINERYCFVKNFSNTNNVNCAILDFIEYKQKENLDSSDIVSAIIEMPDGYVYINKNIEAEKLLLDSNTKIVMQTFSYDDEGNFNFNQSIEFSKLIEKLPILQENGLTNTPFKIRISNNKIISLTEIYMP